MFDYYNKNTNLQAPQKVLKINVWELPYSTEIWIPLGSLIWLLNPLLMPSVLQSIFLWKKLLSLPPTPESVIMPS